MEFYEWFVKMCADNGVTPSFVARAIGVSPAAANGWKNGSTPKSVVLHKIEEYFGAKFKQEDTLETLKEEEKTLLHSYRTMTEEQKRMMLVFAKGLKND